MTAFDFSDADKHEKLMGDPVNVAVNAAIEAAATARQARRARLSRGLARRRRVSAKNPVRLAVSADRRRTASARLRSRPRIRGDDARANAVGGFAFASDNELAFVALEYLQGHADGLIVVAPVLPGGIKLRLPALWECKCVKRDYWNRTARDGLVETFPQYATQVALYQHFLRKKNPVLFTVGCADDCRALHFLVPYDEERALEAVARIERVIAATKVGDLLGRAYPNPDAWQCKRSCGHLARCWRSS